MSTEKIMLDDLYDSELIGKDFSSNSKIALKAVEHVNAVFDKYQAMRTVTRGGKNMNLEDQWDMRYRIYKAIYNKKDHNYNGESRVFNPELRKAVNIVDSEASNALFGREDYYSVEDRGNSKESQEMAREAFGILKHYSDLEEYVYNFQLSIKQALIYDSTWVEAIYDKNKSTGIYRRKEEVPVLDPESGDPLYDEKGNPVTRTEYKIVNVNEDRSTVRIEVRDIYRVYVNHLLDDPEKDDIIYRDAMTVQRLLELAERGVYNKAAVNRLIDSQPRYGSLNLRDRHDTGEGKTFVSNIGVGNESDDEDIYEVFRFQGLFTTEDETSKRKIRQQFWIDIGEREECLRCIISPVIGAYKTFSGCNYDSMVGEFNSDSVISPYQSLQFQINDKENQSLDGLTFNLNSPIEVMINAGIDSKDLQQIRKTPNKIIYTKVKDAMKRLQLDVPLNHLNNEMLRLQSMIQSGTGATSLAGGSPTGTQVDRSGKALNTLLNQTRSQFSRFVRKFEKRMIEKTLQKVWDIIIQFFDEEILIEVEQGDGTVITKMQTPSEVAGQYKISVSAGSQYLKEREYRDSILELLSIAGINDKFIETLDIVPMFQQIALTLSPKLAKYINPDNLINKQSQLINQLREALGSLGEKNKDLFSEVERLQGELKQTDRAAAASPNVVDRGRLERN